MYKMNLGHVGKKDGYRAFGKNGLGDDYMTGAVMHDEVGPMSSDLY